MLIFTTVLQNSTGLSYSPGSWWSWSSGGTTTPGSTTSTGPTTEWRLWRPFTEEMLMDEANQGEEGVEAEEGALPLCSELSEIEVEFGEECRKEFESDEGEMRDSLVEKLLLESWLAAKVTI